MPPCPHCLLGQPGFIYVSNTAIFVIAVPWEILLPRFNWILQWGWKNQRQSKNLTSSLKTTKGVLGLDLQAEGQMDQPQCWARSILHWGPHLCRRHSAQWVLWGIHYILKRHHASQTLICKCPSGCWKHLFVPHASVGMGYVERDSDWDSESQVVAMKDSLFNLPELDTAQSCVIRTHLYVFLWSIIL